MNNTVLFIVEGKSDAAFYEDILNEILICNVEFIITKGDITSNVKYLFTGTDLIEEIVKSKIKNNNFLGDLLKIVMLTDIDACFLDQKFIINKISEIKYNTEYMYVEDKNKILLRNYKKSENLKILYESNSVFNYISFEIYYNCINLEHILFNNPELNDGLKISYAEKLKEDIILDINRFISFLFNTELNLSNDYFNSWEFLRRDKNSLKRLTNLIIFFIKNLNLVKDEYKHLLQ